jgi:predicted acylesterase/phospholipase RssA/CRP-like cAMP-binding protein
VSTSDLAKHLASNELLKNLDEALLMELEEEFELVYLDEGEVLFHQGDPGDNMFVLIQGRLGVRMQDPHGREMVIGEETEPGVSVGEMSLVTGQARSVTVYALSGVELVQLSKEGFDHLVEKRPQVLSELAELTAPRWQRIQLAVALTDLLGEIDTAALLDLQAELEWQQLAQGEVLFHQGEPGDATYIVVNGRLRVSATRPDGKQYVIDESGPGDIVGEFFLITGETRAATVFAIRETTVVKLTPELFTSLLERYPHAMMHITRIIIDRHKRSLRIARAPRTRATNFALVPTNPEVQLTEFTHQLVKNLEAFGSVLHLSSTRLDQFYGKEGAAQTRLDDPTAPILDSWLSEQETKYNFILYEADPTWSTWTRRCDRQADRLLIVGQSNADPTPSPIEDAVRALGPTVRTDLVLIHSIDTVRPAGTSEWLSQREVSAHYHIRLGEDAHYQRMARWLTGQATGLVLSGGGARGFAHLGVSRALDELDILVDCIGGTSMGSLIGAGLAMGRDYEDMVKLAQQFSNPKQLFDYTLPFVSLMASKKITRVMKEVFEELCIEDLWCPYFCVSANLTRAEPIVHQRGSLWKSVRASIAIPGIFSPILHEGDIVVDGGAMNNFPVDTMREICGGGTVIGVNVGQTHEPAQTDPFDTSISGWHVLWSRINPMAKRMNVPNIGSTIIRSMEVSSVYRINTEESLADLVIEPAVMHYGTLDFAAYEDIIELGYQAVHEQLAQIQKFHGL